jgi:hypothetical protein
LAPISDKSAEAAVNMAFGCSARGSLLKGAPLFLTAGGIDFIFMSIVWFLFGFRVSVRFSFSWPCAKQVSLRSSSVSQKSVVDG